MKYTIFSGCLVQTRFPEYEKSTRLILDKLSLEFEFIDNFSCCGSQIVESIDKNTLLVIAGRNLALAEKKGVDIILTLCGSCTYILKKSIIELQDEMKRQKVNKILSKNKLEFNNKIKIKHLAEFLSEEDVFQQLKSNFKTIIKLKLALQNPCMLYRPKRIMQIKKDEKSLISNLLKQIGAKIISQEFQDKCCEGTMLAFKKNIGEPLAKKRYETIIQLGIDLFVVGCPNCQLVYSIFPSVLNSEMIPSIFFPQIIGLALGYSFNEVGLCRNIDHIKIRKILESKSLIKKSRRKVNCPN
ncbi:MAG: heterodisulfide reductase-related iron-sulfur binding cluster [Promethearchaeota archaeon]